MGRASALFQAIDLFDRPLAAHCLAVSIYTRDIASKLGLSEAERNLLSWAARVHDLGKLALPRELVWKPGALTLEERRMLEQHPALAEQALMQGDCPRLAEVVRHQAERFDGLGYPDGLAGEAIPLASRILAVADLYNELTMSTPTRDAFPSEDALRQIVEGAATRFDPSIVAVFHQLITQADHAVDQPVAGTA